SGTNGEGDPGEVADIGKRVAIEDDEIGVKSGLDPALFRGLEIRRRAGRERGEHLALRQSPVHQLVFERGVVDLDEADVRSEQNRAAILRKLPELIDGYRGYLGSHVRI